MIKPLAALAASAAFALSAGAAPALANHVNATTSSASCTGVVAQFEQFSQANNPVTWTNKVDGVQSNAGTIAPAFSGGHTLTFSYPAPLAGPGSHVVVFSATWPGKGENNGTFTKTVEGCPVPPPPPIEPPVPPDQPQPPTVVEPPTIPAPPVVVRVVKQPPTAKRHRCAAGRGRVHVRNSHGRRITLCRSAKPPVVRNPKFTG